MKSYQGPQPSQDPRVTLAVLVYLGLLGLLEIPELREYQDPRVSQVSGEIMAFQVSLDPQGPPAGMENPANLESTVYQVDRVTQAPQEPPESLSGLSPPVTSWYNTARPPLCLTAPLVA